MKKFSKYIVKGTDEVGFHFWCPGCKEYHGIITKGQNKPRWTFNGDVENPTVSPSILVRSGHYDPKYKNGDNCWCTYNKENPNNKAPFECTICHSFVKDGNIQFLNDCTHELAGQTVPIPYWPD